MKNNIRILIFHFSTIVIIPILLKKRPVDLQFNVKGGRPNVKTQSRKRRRIERRANFHFGHGCHILSHAEKLITINLYRKCCTGYAMICQDLAFRIQFLIWAGVLCIIIKAYYWLTFLVPTCHVWADI